MDAEQIKEVLRLHSLWANDKPSGKKANLSGANLSGANLCEAKFTIELNNALSLHKAKYDPEQFQFLALNASFLENCIK